MKGRPVFNRVRKHTAKQHSKDGSPVAEFDKAFPRETERQSRKWAKLLSEARA